MPLDKMPNSEDFIPTHKSTTLHINEMPVACIIDAEPKNKFRYDSLSGNTSIRASLIGFLNKDEEFGLLIGFKLKIQTNDDYFEYTVYPNDDLIDAIILQESIFIINEKLENLFSLPKLMTDQFVKTRSEYNKFQNMLK
ncbi:MAG: hypothetical protein MAG458_01326 [Nitrosopumilus sp.]|nr:hypothetical protein [Nitrosopumilus sp.]